MDGESDLAGMIFRWRELIAQEEVVCPQDQGILTSPVRVRLSKLFPGKGADLRVT
jgi:hypothetical protein